MRRVRTLLLDFAYRRWSSRLRSRWREAIAVYQGTDRTYAIINGVARGDIEQSSLSDEQAALAAKVIADLDAIFDHARLPLTATVYRGIRNVSRTFGIDVPDAQFLIGQKFELAGFTSTSVHRNVALEEFVDRDRGALIEIKLPRRTPAAWLGGAGRPELRYQGEFLLPRGTRILITGARRESGLLLLEGRVTCEQVLR